MWGKLPLTGMVGEMRLKTIEGALIGFIIALASGLAATILSSSHPIQLAQLETHTGPAQPFQTASTIDPEAPLARGLPRSAIVGRRFLPNP